MPHAISPRDAQDDLDDDLIRRMLNDENPSSFGENIFDRELDPGEKADDAVDFGDLSDDDLADDEDAELPAAPDTENASSEVAVAQKKEPQLSAPANNDVLNEFDDLFGDGNSPMAEIDTTAPLPFASEVDEFQEASEQHLPLDLPETQPSTSRPGLGVRPGSPQAEDQDISREQQLQEELFAMSRAGLGNPDQIPNPPENDEELLASLWPKFERDTIPKFMDLLPVKKARYVGKIPPKQPKPLHGTKLNLEIAQDDEKSFTVSCGGAKKTFDDMEATGILPIRGIEKNDKAQDEESDVDSDFENESVAGISWQDMQFLCADWDPVSDSDSSAQRTLVEDSVTGRDWPTSKVSNLW